MSVQDRTTTDVAHSRYVIAASIDSLAADWPALTIPTSAGTPTSAGRTDALPGGTTRLDLMYETHRLLMSWTLLVLDEKFAPHERALLDPLGTDAPAWLGFLRRHGDWIAGHWAGRDAADELAQAAAQVGAAVAPSGVRHIPVGACPVLDCAGVVHATLGDRDDGDLPDLVCDWDTRHTWTPSQYGVLARLLGTDGPARLTPTAAAVWLSDRFRRPITEGMVTGWIRRAPGDTLSLDVRDGTVDRVAITQVAITCTYLARRAHNARVG